MAYKKRRKNKKYIKKVKMVAHSISNEYALELSEYFLKSYTENKDKDKGFRLA